MIPYINVPFEYLSGSLGASVDEPALKRCPDSKPWQKNAFSIGVSLFYLLGLFDLWGGLGNLLVSAIGAYGIAAGIQGPYMPWIAFVFLMGHMSISHIYRMIASDPSVVDVTGAQMVMVMRLTAFCWNVADGQLPDSELADFQKARAVKELPNLLDYFGYVFFFPSLFAGPAFDYVDYKRYISTTMFELPPGVDPSKAPPTRKKRKIPRSGTPAFRKAAAGIVWILVFLKASAYYYTDYLLSPEYLSYGIFRRIWILHMVGVITRTKYYGVWALTEGACILSGIGYNGIDPVTGKANWDRLRNVRPLKIELAQNTHAYLGNWNINTNHWLRNYMYLRVTPKGKKPGFRASMATFVTSAFWHGFYSGYYLTFILASFHQYIAKNARRLLRPFFMQPVSTTSTSPGLAKQTEPKGNAYKPYYDVFTWLVTQLAFSYTVAPFFLLLFRDSMVVWARVYFYCLVGVLACIGFLLSPGKTMLLKRLNARKGLPPGGKPGLDRSYSTDSVGGRAGTTLGLPDDPEREVQDIVNEVRREIESRRVRGLSVDLDVRKVVEENVGELKGMREDGRS